MVLTTLKDGLLKGAKTTYTLARILVPVYFIVTFLKHTPILDWIAVAFAPLMSLFGLPGEAALVLVLSNVVNLYAGMGAITAIDLTPYQITTVCLMIAFSHSLIVETAVVRKVGVKGWHMVAVRISLAMASGMTMGLIGRGL